MTRLFQKIWIDQCAAARMIIERHGQVAALEYLIGEKLMTYAEMAKQHPEFARELPCFVAAVRDIFSGDDILMYADDFEKSMRADDRKASARAEQDQEDLPVTSTQRKVRRRQFAVLKELLTVEHLGTS